MLDFAEATGRFIADPVFRTQLTALLDKLPAATENKNYIVFSEASYKQIGDFLAGRLLGSRYSNSLYVVGEVIRVFKAGMPTLTKLSERLEEVAPDLAKAPQPAGNPADYYATLGAATIDVNVRDRYLFGSPVAGLPYEMALLPILSDQYYSDNANSFCDRNWACGCGVRMVEYPGHQHPLPTMANCFEGPAPAQ